jgi:hypothetical protein
MVRREGRPDLTPAQQYLFLKHSRVGQGRGTLGAVRLNWEYRERPTPLSREYTIRIEYDLLDGPRVFITEPDIAPLAGDREIPHVYKNPLRPCLYLPGSGEWEPTMRLDQTIVPWALVWLFYFEEWLGSNEWKGGGVHPDEHRISDRNRRGRRTAQRGSR